METVQQPQQEEKQAAQQTDKAEAMDVVTETSASSKADATQKTEEKKGTCSRGDVVRRPREGGGRNGPLASRESRETNDESRTNARR